MANWRRNPDVAASVARRGSCCYGQVQCGAVRCSSLGRYNAVTHGTRQRDFSLMKTLSLGAASTVSVQRRSPVGSSATEFSGSGAHHRADQEGQVLARVAPVRSVYHISSLNRANKCRVGGLNSKISSLNARRYWI
jgi:hypothetical protein